MRRKRVSQENGSRRFMTPNGVAQKFVSLSPELPVLSLSCSVDRRFGYSRLQYILPMGKKVESVK